MAKTDSPRPVSTEALARIAAWSRRKPRVALMGEFSSGKSTLLNLLIGADLLPTRVTATELPTVWFSHGQPRAFWVDKRGGRHELDFGRFDGVPISARYVRIFTPAPMLQHCDIIDTPGISDPNLEEDCWRFAIGQANFILWCTSSTQAWRETERSTWMSMPLRLRANSALVVTRADKLSEIDREKVARRLARESFGLLNGVVFLSTLDAVRGKALLAETGDASLWQRSGGADLDAKIRAGVAAVRAERADLLDRYVPGKAAPPRAAEILSLTPAMRAGEPAPAWAEPVRPRRVELPETPRRTERPASGGPDPLDAIRAGCCSLRETETEAAPALARAEPTPVLRLPDPAERLGAERAAAAEGSLRREGTEPPPGADRNRAAALAARIAPPPYAGEGEGEPEPRSPDQREPLDRPAAVEEPLGAVLAALAESEPTAEPAAPAEPPLPRAVRIWRDIVQRSPEIPSNSPLLAMIDQLLVELSREDEQSDGTGRSGATVPGRIWAA